MVAREEGRRWEGETPGGGGRGQERKAQVGKMGEVGWEKGGGEGGTDLPNVLLSLGQRGLLQGGCKLPHSILQSW